MRDYMEKLREYVSDDEIVEIDDLVSEYKTTHKLQFILSDHKYTTSLRMLSLSSGLIPPFLTRSTFFFSSFCRYLSSSISFRRSGMSFFVNSTKMSTSLLFSAPPDKRTENADLLYLVSFSDIPVVKIQDCFNFIERFKH